MQEVPGGDAIATVAIELAKQSLWFAALLAFIRALRTRELSWRWEPAELRERIEKLTAEYEARIVKQETHHAAIVEKLEAKIDRLETENRKMIDIMTTNTQTTSAAVAGFNRALDEQDRSRWDGKERRSTS